MKKTILTFILLLCYFIGFSQTKINPEEFPYVYSAKLLMYKNGITYHGSGIIINENSVLTNAHNVEGKDSIHILPGYSKKNNAPFGKISVKCELGKSIFYDKRYNIDSLKNHYDYAVVKFDNKEVYDAILVKSNFKKFDLEFIENLDNFTLHISGYPYFRWFEFWRPRRARVHYYNSTDKFTLLDNNTILKYKLNTRKGSSGSPLWIEKDGKFIVIGIHKSGSGFKNEGIFYNEEKVALLRKWLSK